MDWKSLIHWYRQPPAEDFTTMLGIKRGVFRWLLHNAAKRTFRQGAGHVVVRDCMSDKRIKPGRVVVWVYNMPLSQKERRKLEFYVNGRKPHGIGVVFHYPYRACPGCDFHDQVGHTCCPYQQHKQWECNCEERLG